MSNDSPTNVLPEGFELVRTTDVFTNETVPAGLLNAHHVANKVWGRLVVHSGSVGFVFEDDPHNVSLVSAGEAFVIPPARKHHLELSEPAQFAVEFYRLPAEPVDSDAGLESTGLEQ